MCVPGKVVAGGGAIGEEHVEAGIIVPDARASMTIFRRLTRDADRAFPGKGQAVGGVHRAYVIARERLAVDHLPIVADTVPDAKAIVLAQDGVNGADAQAL